MLKLMYITNRPDVAQIVENTGVDRIFVDMEYIGKTQRQGGMDTVQSHHTLKDVQAVRQVLKKAELLVRINPIHDAAPEYTSSEEEIQGAIAAGADILILPFFQTAQQVQRFLTAVDGRAKTMLLVETPEAVENMEDILALEGIDYIHIGLNDLSLGYKRPFMFELLTDGTVERLCDLIRQKGIPYGFGGIAALGKGLIPAEMIIREHYRLGSGCAILSRSFCNADKMEDLEQIRSTFEKGIGEIRALEAECAGEGQAYFAENKQALEKAVQEVRS